MTPMERFNFDGVDVDRRRPVDMDLSEEFVAVKEKALFQMVREGSGATRIVGVVGSSVAIPAVPPSENYAPDGWTQILPQEMELRVFSERLSMELRHRFSQRFRGRNLNVQVLEEMTADLTDHINRTSREFFEASMVPTTVTSVIQAVPRNNITITAISTFPSGTVVRTTVDIRL